MDIPGEVNERAERHSSADGQRKWSEVDVGLRRGGDVVVSRGPKHVAVV